jgi:hypothetical protein
VRGLLVILLANGLERREVLQIFIDVLRDALNDVLNLVFGSHPDYLNNINVMVDENQLLFVLFSMLSMVVSLIGMMLYTV